MRDGAGHHSWTLPWLNQAPTGGLATVGASIFVSGFFVLAAAGTSYPAGTYALILGAAVALIFPLLLMCLAIAGSETAARRAWATGFRRLAAVERTRSATAERGLRYASWLWLANGGAFWLATIATRF